MKKNDLIKTENGIFRILSIEADIVLAIDCIRKTMPKFYPIQLNCRRYNVKESEYDRSVDTQQQYHKVYTKA